MINFVYPTYLLLLGLIPLFVFINYFSIKYERKNALKFANFDEIAKIKGADIVSNNMTILFISIVIYALIILSLSSPIIDISLPSSDSSYALVVDSSRSMEANDFLPSRLEAAKDVSKQFVDNVGEGVKFSVISFSGNALVKKDLTDDKEVIKGSIDSIQLSGIGGTDIAEAVTTSTNILRAEPNKKVVLLSDGEINVDGLDEAIAYAKENGIIFYTIAMGTVKGGNTTFGISIVDESSLKSLAFETGGKFFSPSSKEELLSSFSQINEQKLKNVPVNITKYLLLFTAFLFLIAYTLYSTRYRVY